MASMPSSCLIWLTRDGTAASGDEGEWLGLKLALKRLVRGMLSRSGDSASLNVGVVLPRTLIMGALDERFRLEPVPTGGGGSTSILPSQRCCRYAASIPLSLSVSSHRRPPSLVAGLVFFFTLLRREKKKIS